MSGYAAVSPVVTSLIMFLALRTSPATAAIATPTVIAIHFLIG
jgi:hypothetical protein